MADAPTNGQMEGLDNDFLMSILASGKDRNVYGPKIVEFDELGVNGVDVLERWPVLQSKVAGGMKLSSVALGFRNKLKEQEITHIVVKQVEDKVFLINMNLVKVAA